MITLIGLVSLVLKIMTFAVVARAILSFVVPMAGARPHPYLLAADAFIRQITEPILGPIRRVLPTMGNLDFSPMVAILLLIFLRGIITRGSL